MRVVAVEVFRWLVCSSVMAAVLILTVLIIKMFFGNKFGARWQYLIWLIVILKMMIPFGPESKLSIFNVLSLTDQNITSTSYDVVNTISTATSYIAQNTPIPDFYAPQRNESLMDGFHFGNSTYLSIFGLGIWLMGALAVGIVLCRRNIRYNHSLEIGKNIRNRKIIKILKEGKNRFGIRGYVAMREVSNLKSPALFGIKCPQLLLPTDLLKSKEYEKIKYVIYHELAHLRRKDIPVNILLSVLVVIHWFNPFIWYALYKIRQDIELACDELVLSRLQAKERKNYGLTLIQFFESISANIQVSNAVAFLGDQSLLKRRIVAIASYKKKSLILSILAVIVFTFLSMTLFTNAVGNMSLETGKAIYTRVDQN
ncbi:MAG: M56 family metallopeptidase [Clostridia bacterium]|nr:M56 family metallopeptidase [Clostridia bacterium]